MATEKFFELLQRLRIATSEGRASWATGSRDDTFVWSGSAASVLLATQDNDGLAPYVVRLIDSDGRAVEEAVVSQSNGKFGLVKPLYELARADALDINSTIDSLLEELGPDDESSGSPF